VSLLPTLLASVAALTAQSGAEPVRVGVLSLLRPEAVRITCAEGAVLVAGDNTAPISLAPGERITVEAGAAELAIIAACSEPSAAEWELPACASCRICGPGGAPARLSVEVLRPLPFNRTLSGTLEIRAGAGRLQMILEVELEELVATVAAAELGADVAQAAAAALAVAVRSYVAANRGRHGAEGFDICDSTHCVLFRGESGAFGPLGGRSLELGRSAARLTAGLVLTDGGRVVPGYFHACCGGATASPAQIWGPGSGSDALAQVRCGLCSSSPHFGWQRRAPLEDILASLGIEAETGCLSVTHSRNSALAETVRVECGGEQVVFTAEQFRIQIGRALGWNVVRSNCFTVRRENDEVVFEGRGFGHGVGLCLAGAVEAASRGWTWLQIIRHYFPRWAVTPLSAIPGAER